MHLIWRTPIPLIVLALMVVGGVWGWEHYNNSGELVNADSATAAGVYTNKTFGYSVAYPEGYESREFEPELVEIGSTQNGAFASKAEIAVLYAGQSDPLPSFEDFEQLSVGLACDVTGASPVHCTSVASSSPFTTGSGFPGEELYFDSSAGQRGPFFAFDISGRTSEGKYAVLLIYPPPNLAQGGSDAAFLENTAASLRMR